jgi:hypothetical protein
MKNVLTYRNQDRKLKTFKEGQVVLHRQLQVSTGQGGAFKPNFTGPYVINKISKNQSSATIQHLHTGNEIKAHFTNIQLLQYDPATARLPSNFDDIVEQFLPEKYTIDVYYPHSKQKRKERNEKNRQKLARLNSEDSDSDIVDDLDSLSDTDRQGYESPTPLHSENKFLYPSREHNNFPFSSFYDESVEPNLLSRKDSHLHIDQLFDSNEKTPSSLVDLFDASQDASDMTNTQHCSPPPYSSHSHTYDLHTHFSPSFHSLSENPKTTKTAKTAKNPKSQHNLPHSQSQSSDQKTESQIPHIAQNEKLLSNQPSYVPDYLDLRIDVDRLPGDRIFVQDLTRYNDDPVLKPSTNQENHKELTKQARLLNSHSPFYDTSIPSDRPRYGYLLRGNEKIYFTGYQTFEIPTAENYSRVLELEYIDDSLTYPPLHSDINSSYDNIHLQNNSDLNNTFDNNDGYLNDDSSTPYSQEEMNSLQDQLQQTNSELDSAFEDLKAEFSKPSYFDQLFKSNSDPSLNISSNESQEQMDIDQPFPDNSFGKLSDEQTNTDDILNSLIHHSKTQISENLSSTSDQNLRHQSPHLNKDTDDVDLSTKNMFDNTSFSEREVLNDNLIDEFCSDTELLKLPKKQKSSKKIQKRKKSKKPKPHIIVPKILKPIPTQIPKSTLITPQIFQSVHKNSPKHLRQRDKF